MKLLVLDIDETLIHTEFNEPDSYDFTMIDGKTIYYIKKRPYLDEFIKYVVNNFEIGVFTTAMQDYAEFVLTNIGLDISKLKFVWDRNKCSLKYSLEFMDILYTKNLSKVSKAFKYKLDNILIIDDKPETACNNYGNLIQVKPFYSDNNDTELLKLISYLDKIKNTENVRNIEKRGWYNN